MALKLKQIKDRELQQQYAKAGLLWHDFPPLAVKWRGAYWVKKAETYSYPKLLPELSNPDATDYSMDYSMFFISVED